MSPMNPKSNAKEALQYQSGFGKAIMTLTVLRVTWALAKDMLLNVV